MVLTKKITIGYAYHYFKVSNINGLSRIKRQQHRKYWFLTETTGEPFH